MCIRDRGVIVMRFKDEGDYVIALALADKEPEEAPVSDTPEAAE